MDRRKLTPEDRERPVRRFRIPGRTGYWILPEDAEREVPPLEEMEHLFEKVETEADLARALKHP